MTRRTPTPFVRPAIGPARTAEPEPAPRRPPAAPPVTPPRRTWLVLLAIAIFLAILLGQRLVTSATTEELTYTQFLADLQHHEVTAVEVGDAGQLTGTLKDGRDFVTQAPPWALSTNALAHQLQAAHVTISAAGMSTFGQLAMALAPGLLIVGLLVWMARRTQRMLGSGGGGLGGLMRTRSRVTDAERPAVRFSDVAGYDGVKQEIREVVDFLQNPERYSRAGAQGPRGVLLVGPPGTGKTLLARAVAGEAQVPFFAVTGSSFVEVFVGLGASRVRDLFAEARRSAPAIVFIDEIDAIGGHRSRGGLGANDEREQTLNQLLAEMDGFAQDASVVVLANTNRPDVLDPALLRPGRFDRQVHVPLPTMRDRQRILEVHVQDKLLSPSVDLSREARAAAGFSGADLANLVNEAAMRAARDDRVELLPADFDEARDRLTLGLREESGTLLPEERRTVAIHESGHALVAALSPAADPVAKITILPSGPVLGATHQLPEDDRRLYTEEFLRDTLVVQLGGRAAERVVLGQVSTGAASDLAGATRLAVRMVREFGLSATLGPAAYPVDDVGRLGAERPYAEATQRLVDREVSRLLREAEERAIAVLVQHRAALDELAQRLLDEETVDGSVVYDIVGKIVTGPPAPTPLARIGAGPGHPALHVTVGPLGPRSSAPTTQPNPEHGGAS
ncbi:cell division protein FtsH [Nocardioides gansuensis]|uniref:ATP-dependent zinc metalloprotease FtsH n=1 Tax=Nocardioides gansuensis TaxID=2138300 RepID=A0A2T8FE75_9ACTN|nr:ATP-dependent zinc metalloprotease FtsH [Nocardioides gansuensis]PVG83989.1 cell division protein FtsH [Nocardioides gansuensis]